MEPDFKLKAGAIILSATAVAFILTFGIREVMLGHAKPSTRPAASTLKEVVPPQAKWQAAAAGQGWTGPVTVVATDDVVCDTSGRHCDPVAESVTRILAQRFGGLNEYGATAVWINGEYSQYGITKYTRILERLHKVELWAKELPPGQTRSAYLAVVEQYQDGAAASLNEIHDRREQQEMAEFNRKQKECEQAAKQYRRGHKLPEPPQ